MFTNNIDENVEILRELVAAIPPSQRQYAKKAAVMLEKTWNEMQRAYPKNAAVALGMAFAVYLIAQRIVEQAKESDGKGLIQLIG